ncbi:hypothetical protein [Klugiella xanthotipulae]|nr:hypothetical protein [Klugiella xanthotipulae]
MSPLETEFHRKCNEAHEYLILVKNAFRNAEATISQYQRAIGGFEQVRTAYHAHTGRDFQPIST